MKATILIIIEGGCYSDCLTNIPALSAQLRKSIEESYVRPGSVDDACERIIQQLSDVSIELLDWDNIHAGDSPDLSDEALALLSPEARTDFETAVAKYEEQRRLDLLSDGDMNIVEG